MQFDRFGKIGIVGMSVMVGVAAVTTGRTQATQLPDCTGWSNCNPGRGICTFEPSPAYYGSTVIADIANGLSSDGRGPYRNNTDGVGRSWAISGLMALGFDDPPVSGVSRTFSLNLGNPVAGSGAVPLGTVTIRGDNLLYTSWRRVGNVMSSLEGIRIGETVAAGQINISFHLDGRFHVLQMGPQALGHCHEGGTTKVHGRGTTAGTIHRAGQSRWVVDVPAGSEARLFDASHTVRHAVDKGLYRIGLRYELVNAVPGAGSVLRPLAETHGGAAVVARYRLMKRDSADAYFFSAQEVVPAAFYLYENKQIADALLVFRLGAEEFPDNTNLHGGLGESLLAVGDTSAAISSLRRAVALNPDNRRAGDALRRLGITP